MTDCTTLRITISQDKKVNFDVEGKPMHPIEVIKVMHMMCGQLLNKFKDPEESKIIKPDTRLVG